MTVYFAQTRIDPSKVKIGFTADIEKRRANLSVSVPGGINIMATMAGGRDAEDYLHQKFEIYRVGGEWFSLEGELDEFIRNLRNGVVPILPLRDMEPLPYRATSEYSADALELARQMALAILNTEHRGVGDTVGAACYRVEVKHGIGRNLIRRLRYRHEKSDIWAGEFLHIKSVFEQAVLSREKLSTAGVGMASTEHREEA